MSVPQNFCVRSLPFDGYLPAPFAAVKVCVRIGDYRIFREFVIQYWGEKQDLINCGAVTPELLASRRRYPRDTDGDCVQIYRNGWRRKSDRICVELRKSPASSSVLTLPGFETWMINAATVAPAVALQPTHRRPYLRLVVDNKVRS
jgi:hypothetical protein